MMNGVCGWRWRSVVASTAVVLLAESPVRAAVFTVSNTTDAAAGSLRAAVTSSHRSAPWT